MSTASSALTHPSDVDFASLVRLLRQSRGQTQEEFARDVDVTVGTLNGWENGRHRPVRAQRNRLLRMASDAQVPVPSVRQKETSPL